MRLLSALTPPAGYFDHHLHFLIICRMAKLGMQHGISDATPHGYSHLGMILGPVFHRYRDAQRFANLACDLVDKHGIKLDREPMSIGSDRQGLLHPDPNIPAHL